ncbi:MAG: FHA domain-containing protein [Gammaproteobacteria bacterium]
MGRTTEQSSAHIQEAERGPRDRLPPAAADPIPVALDFLRACRDERRPLALVTGAAGTGKSMLVRRFQREIENGPVAHIKMPTDSPHAFLERLLGEFGFDAFDSTISDLDRLTRVYLQHEARKGLRPVVIVEEVQNCGPAVWNAIRDLAIPGSRDKPAALFVLTGSPGFDSQVMAPAFNSVYSLDVTVRTSVLPPESDCDSVEVMYRDQSLGTWRLDRAKTTIGRNGANHIHIGGAFVSRFHAVLAKEPDGIHVIDLRSTNGTFVNGVRVQRQRLQDGDLVEIEEFSLRFRDTAGSEEESSPADGTDTLVMQAPLDHLLDRSA